MASRSLSRASGLWSQLSVVAALRSGNGSGLAAASAGRGIVASQHENNLAAWRSISSSAAEAPADEQGAVAVDVSMKPPKGINQWRRMRKKQDQLLAAAAERKANVKRKNLERDAKRREKWAKGAALWSQSTSASAPAPEVSTSSS